MSTNNTDVLYRKLELKKHSLPYRILNRMLKSPYVLISPAVIIALFTTLFPMLFCIVISFCNWDLIGGHIKFIGLSNYKFIFSNDIFLKTLRNTVVYMLVTVFVGLTLKILCGVFLNKQTRRHNLVQTVMFTPEIIASVAIAMVFRYLMMPQGGLLNSIIEFFGGKPVQWLLGQDTALLSVIIVSLWSGLGYGALLVISGLRAIPNYIYDAAKLDKSGKANTFFRITLPLLSPTIFFMLVTSTVGAFTSFDTVKLMTGGGPNNSSNLIALYIYQQGFRYLHYGRAMAASVVLLLITCGLSLLNFRLAGRKVHYQ